MHYVSLNNSEAFRVVCLTAVDRGCAVLLVRGTFNVFVYSELSVMVSACFIGPGGCRGGGSPLPIIRHPRTTAVGWAHVCAMEFPAPRGLFMNKHQKMKIKVGLPINKFFSLMNLNITFII